MRVTVGFGQLHRDAERTAARDDRHLVQRIGLGQQRRHDREDLQLGGSAPASGALDGVRAIFGGHVDRRFPVGQVVAQAGPLAASADAFQVKRIKEAGAIVIAKSNMAEFAFSPYETVGSFLPGYTFNPYALNRVPAGSSGGTAAAVSASLGAVGLGTIAAARDLARTSLVSPGGTITYSTEHGLIGRAASELGRGTILATVPVRWRLDATRTRGTLVAERDADAVAARVTASLRRTGSLPAPATNTSLPPVP